MIIGYGKIGRSMPLTLAGCGNLGGDVECAAVVGELARRYPQHKFMLLGRNSGERPADVGLPDNVVNPWIEWGPYLRAELNRIGVKTGLTPEKQLQVIEVLDQLTQEAFVRCDGHVMWVGQHGTTNAPIPRIEDRSRLTKPYDWSIYYASFMLRGINAWRDVDPVNREEVYLNADARNRHKMRDLKWPLHHPVLTQFTFVNNIKHERYDDTERAAHRFADSVMYEEMSADQLRVALWHARVHNVYSRLEVNGLRPGTPFGDLISYDENWDRPGHLGLFINEARAVGVRPEVARVNVFKQWVEPLEPYFVHGTWSDASQRQLQRTIVPAPWDMYYPRLHSVRCTFTTPSSGSGWATAKPWEAFAAGTVCFFHPAYDTQDNILGDAHPELRAWLRVNVPEELERRVRHLNSDAGRTDWLWLIDQQRRHFNEALRELRYMRMIEERLGLR